MTAWFAARYGAPTPVQRAAWPRVAAGQNVLLVSPTGTGKTLAAFLSVLNELALSEAAGYLPEGIQAIYLSPLRALGYDLEKNLRDPLREVYGADSPIRVGLRSGDTPATERGRQAARPPHLLLTTPESLQILLSQARWLPHLASVRWVIVDEVHALAESKRGAHLALSLERLEALREAAGGPALATAEEHSRVGVPLQRIGLSATVAPLDRIARFLVGANRSCEIIDAGADKQIRIDVYTPLGEEPYPPAGYTGVRLMGELAALVRRHRTTLVFSNTRSGAEAATYWLRRELPELQDRIECHHASLDRDVRLEVEDRLKRGELRAVICSTSLELGIDIGSVDLVVMLAAPKGVSRALQRTGRAGHDLRRISHGLLMATHLNDLVECCATARLARRRHLDEVRLPQAPLDVLAQHLVGMGCIARWSRARALELVRRADAYRALSEDEFADVLDFLAGGGRALRAQYTEVFGKIQLDEDGFETRSGSVRRDFLQNAGVIPNEGSVRVRHRLRVLGTVEEGFVRGLRPGDVFMLAGRPVRVQRGAPMELFVEPADSATPTVPRWNANKMPLSNRVAGEILDFRTGLRARFEAGDTTARSNVPWIADRLECEPANAAIIHRIHLAQHRVSEIPTNEVLLIEEFVSTAIGEDLASGPSGSGAGSENAADAGRRGGRPGKRTRAARWARATGPSRHYVFHALIGRAANDALSRVVAMRLGRLRGGNAIATPDDYGFVLSVAPEQVVREEDLAGLLDPDGLASDLERSLGRSELLKYHFRNAAQTGLMVYRNYFGDRKSPRKLQWSTDVIYNVLREHEPDHVLLREARRDAAHSYLDLEGAERFLRHAATVPRRLRAVARVPPLSFAMYASRIREALLVEDPRETMERLFHLWWRNLEETAEAGER